jgi:hypothetical protein
MDTTLVTAEIVELQTVVAVEKVLNKKVGKTG